MQVENKEGELGTSWLPTIVLLVGAILQLVRILQVQSNTGEVPFLSANDRSRWCTIASLSVNGSYEIDQVLEIRDPKTRRRTWYTIDLVQHRGLDGQQHFYSSKPPLLPTLYAGAYLGVRTVTGATLMNDTFFAARCVLILVSWLPLVLFWWVMLQWFRRLAADDWSLTVMATFLVFGTYLSTFAVTLNNHLPAAISVGVSLLCYGHIIASGSRSWVWFALAGMATAFGAANDLPALSWVAAMGALLALVDFRKTLMAYIPALVPVAVAFFGLNYAAHGVWKPAYAHRKAGPEICRVDGAAADTPDAQLPAIQLALQESGINTGSDSEIRIARQADTWELWDSENQTRYAIQSAPAGGWIVRVWGDWYDYPTSYWKDGRKQGVDKGEPNRALYVMHCLVGHQGLFSLTPLWLIAILGCIVLWQQRKPSFWQDHQTLLLGAIVSTTMVVLAFYFSRGVEDRNYGGVSSGFRWTFWLIPLWTWLLAHGLNAVKSRLWRAIAVVLLCASVFSAMFPWRNPWTSPWIMQFGEYLGWL